MCPTFWIKWAGMMPSHPTMTHMGSMTLARLDYQGHRRAILEDRLLRPRPAHAFARSKRQDCNCACADHYAGGGVLRSRIISTQTQQNCSLKSQHWSLRQQQKRNANTVFRFTVQTPCFDLVFQTYMLQTRCLPFLPNSPVANTVLCLITH